MSACACQCLSAANVDACQQVKRLPVATPQAVLCVSLHPPSLQVVNSLGKTVVWLIILADLLVGRWGASNEIASQPGRS
jgi:hypothetical protein